MKQNGSKEMNFKKIRRKIDEAMERVEKKDAHRGTGDQRMKEMSNGDLPQDAERNQHNRAATSNS